MKFIIAILLGLILSITIAFTIIHHPILDRLSFLKNGVQLCQSAKRYATICEYYGL